MVVRNPRACKSLARDAATIPLPKDDVTPPVTKMYLAFFMLIFPIGKVMLRDTKIT